MAEYIKRESKVKKIELPEDYDKVQVSINNWGHLTVRFFNGDEPNKDVLIVFDIHTTRKIVGFIQSISRGYMI